MTAFRIAASVDATTASQTWGLLAPTSCATATMTKSSAVDVSKKAAALVQVFMGRTVQTALSNPVGFRFQGSSLSSGDDGWEDIAAWQNRYTAATGINPASNLLNGATSAGATTITMDSTTGVNAGDLVFFNESTKYEWARLVSAASASTITPLDPLTYAHADNTPVLDLAESFSFVADLRPYQRVRLVIDTAAAATDGAIAVGQTVVVGARIALMDSWSDAA